MHSVATNQSSELLRQEGYYTGVQSSILALDMWKYNLTSVCIRLGFSACNNIGTGKEIDFDIYIHISVTIITWRGMMVTFSVY